MYLGKVKIFEDWGGIPIPRNLLLATVRSPGHLGTLWDSDEEFLLMGKPRPHDDHQEMSQL